MSDRFCLRHLRLVVLAFALACAHPFHVTALAQAPGAAPAGGPAEQAAQQALELFNAGRTKEAIAAYEGVIKNFPTASVVSEAQFRLGYLFYLAGDYDKSIETLKKILAPPALPEIQELAYSFLPQAMSAKAARMKADDPARVAAFKEAIKQFDVFIQKYPASEEIQSANYGKALTYFQIEDYEAAAAALRQNLAKFAASESILDSQYMLALTLAAQGNALARTNAQPQAVAKWDEAMRLLGDIIGKRTDVALANDAQFQLAEVLFNRAPFEPEASRASIYQRALDAYQAVQPKEIMVKAQEARTGAFVQRLRAARLARDVAMIKRLERLQEREQEKLEVIKSKGDSTVLAKLRAGVIMFQQQKFDEARTMLRYLQPFANEDEDQKKLVLYYLTLTYASQGLAEKAVQNYEAFQAAHKGDPVAENLPVVMGTMFLNPDPKVNDPARAISYFKEALALYPKNQFTAEIMTQQASALMQLKQFGEALEVFKKFLATNPRKDLAAAAEFGIAAIYQQTAKIDEAIQGFKGVRDKYSDAPQAEQATFFVGQLLTQKGDNKGAVAELNSFLTKYPQSPLVPNALFVLAQAQQSTGDKAGALASYERLAKEFPKSEAAPFSYFQRATLYAADQKNDEMVKAMRDFIAAYPENPNVFVAYDSIAQTQINAQKVMEAVATYREMVDKLPDNPKAGDALLKIGSLWLNYAQKQGRYLALNEEQRVEWNKGVQGAIEASEQLVTKFPESEAVAFGLQYLLEAQRLLAGARLKTEPDVEKYFQDLAAKFDAAPGTRSKVLFTLASYTYEKDKAKALAQMSSAYNPELKFAPADLDLYGGALIEQGKLDEAAKVYAKLASDYPNPNGIPANQAPQQIQDAQAIALYGTGKVLQLQGKIAEAGAKFDALKQTYPRSPKILEANYGIALSLFEQKKYDEAIALLGGIVRATTATADLRANAFLLNARCFAAKGDIAAGIDNFLKIPVFFPAVNKASAEGLWNGGQLLEQQAATLPDSTKEKDKPTKPGQIGKAVKAYKDLVDKYPDSEHAPKAQARLAAIAPGK